MYEIGASAILRKLYYASLICVQLRLPAQTKSSFHIGIEWAGIIVFVITN